MRGATYKDRKSQTNKPVGDIKMPAGRAKNNEKTKNKGRFSQ